MNSKQGTSRNWWGWLQPPGEALRFLTVLPVPGLPPASKHSFAAAVPWFPLAGLVIGLLLLLVGWLTGALWGAQVRAACLVVAWGGVTAGMHLDGLGDTFDAVLSWRSPERKLEIMKDSHMGAMGVLALVTVLLLKFVWLQAAGDGWWVVVLLAPVWGRWADMYGLFWFPAARAGGLGDAFNARTQRHWFLPATAATVLLALLIGQGHGLAAGLLVWGTTHLLAVWWTHDLGGMTGDTYGALCEIGEVVALAALTV